MGAPITIVNGEYKKNGGAYTSAAGTVENGDTIQVRATSSASYATEVSATVTVGDYSTDFDITTKNEVGNEERQGTFQRNDCAVGSSGTYYTYIVPADTYFADTLAEANDLADDDIAANGQNEANINAYCIVDTVTSVLVVDMYDDTSLDVCAYIDTVGVAESGNIVARDGLNFFEATDSASSAFMLSSDEVNISSLVRRFQFNIGRLIGLYPAIPVFTFRVRGRSGSAGAKDGVFALKYPTQTMTMTGSPGSYMPSITPAGGPTPTGWISDAIGGADGTVGVGVGNIILTFNYDVATNVVSIITV